MKDAIEIPLSEMQLAAEEAAGVLRVLSNSSRLMILCHLVEGPARVGQIEEALGLGQAYVSQQLARLRAEGLVTATRSGREMHYALSDPRVTPILQSVYDVFCGKKREENAG